MEVQRTKRVQRREKSDPGSIERHVRQRLADKVSGNMMGIWLLVPEHLRLGTWDLLQGWTGQPDENVEPRLALQLLHEAALCVSGVRQGRTLSDKGFELANGLPFIASDQAIHQLLDAHTVEQAQALQVALGRIRRATGHYQGKLLAIDPHHLRSHTKRQTPRRQHRHNEQATKTLQTFFCLDADTCQPLGFGIASPAKTATQGAKELLGMAAQILNPTQGQTLVLADKEHCTAALFAHAAQHTPFDLLTPMPNTSHVRKQLQSLPDEAFTGRWAGLATTTRPHRFFRDSQLEVYQMVQRLGEGENNRHRNAFLCTAPRDELASLTQDFPKRWHIEEFFNTHQALGWKRAGTLNLNIRYGQASVALLAQASLHQLRQRLGPPYANWEASHLAQTLFKGLDGDLRVQGDTIFVTYYNAPNAQKLREQYENLPQKLVRENVDPHVPWLYNFKLDFRFK